MKVYLIDGSSYVYRAYYAIQGLTDSRGRPTNAIFGFTNMLMKIIRDLGPDALAVAFDTPHPTERHELYEDYKAHRPETPDDLVAQIPHIKEIVRALGIKIFEEPGYEADDVLATLAREGADEGDEVFIVTGDKDMLQLIDDAVKVYDPVKDVVLDREHVIERLGVPPERVTEFMALVGDATDNIPGVKGVGEKTARILLEQFSSLDELMAHPERIERERTRKLITGGVEDIKLSKQLSEINRQVPLSEKPEDLVLKEPDWRVLMGLFREFEFSSLMKLVPGDAKVQRKCEAVYDSSRLKEILERAGDGFAFDTETTGLDPRQDSLVGFSVCAREGEAAYVPLAHSYIGAPEQLDRAVAVAAIKSLLEDGGVPKTGHNLKFDIQVMQGEGVNIRGTLYDTMLASYILNPLRQDHSLSGVSLDYLGLKKQTYAEVAGKRGFQEVPVEPDAARYACEDAEVALELKGLLFSRLEDEGLSKPYFDIEMPLISVLAHMELTGMKLDSSVLEDLSKELETGLDSVQQRVFFLAGREFNINSPKQLGTVLFDELGLTPRKKKKTGYSTDVSVLEELSEEHELPREVLNWRSLYKLKATYADVLPTLVNPKTGRVHTSFNQAATATGRLSSSNPNLQNIPVRGHWGERIREAFVGEPGSFIVSADYSQIELRILAHLSGDKVLTEAFEKGLDVHSRTAAELYGVKESKVDSEMRRVAKTVNFGVVYGMSPFGLSVALGIGRQDASEYIEKYFEVHSGVKEYIDRAIEDAKKRGFVETMYGRRRPVPELSSRNAARRSLGERLAVNSPIQGTAADIIKIAMIKILKRLEAGDTGARMVLQVHDELVFEVPRKASDALKELVVQEMQGAAELSVPLDVEIGSGPDWAKAHP